MSDRINVTAMSFTEYVMSGQRGRITIVGEQRGMYLSEDRRMCGFYNPVRGAMRRAVNSPTPEREFERAFDAVDRTGQARAFQEVADGFLPWLQHTGATGVPVEKVHWSAGDLTLRVSPHLGLRRPDGSVAAVLVHLKEVPLTREAATIALRILQRTHPEFTPMVLDARRGRSFEVWKRTNTTKLDALIAAEAAGYVVHWRMSA